MRSGLARIAVEERLATSDGLAAAEAHARTSGERLVVALVEIAGVADVAICSALAGWLKLVPIGHLDPEPEAIRELGQEAAHRLRALPMSVEVPIDGPRLLRVAMADPTDEEALDEIESATGCRVDPVLARLSVLDDALTRAYRAFVTQVMPRTPSATVPVPEKPPSAVPPASSDRRPPFGGDLSVSTPHLGTGTGGPATAPFRRIDDDAPLEVRLSALLAVLEAKGLIGIDEYLAEVRRQLERE